MAKKKKFVFPDDLKALQAELEAARAAYVEYRYALPKWAEPMEERKLADGTVVPAEPGWTDEQRAEEGRLLEGERRAALALGGHEYWSALPVEDRVDARAALTHLGSDV